MIWAGCICVPLQGQTWTGGPTGPIYYNGGNVGIGTPSPWSRLVVADTPGNSFEFVPSGTANTNWLQSFNRTAGTYNHLVLNGASHLFHISGTERMRIDTSGNVGIGTTNPDSSVMLHVVNPNTYGRIFLDGYGGATTGGVNFAGRSARGTPSSPSPVLSGDLLLYLTGRGWDGSVFNNGAYIGMFAAQDWTTAAHATEIRFNISGGTEAMRIASTGNVGIGTTSPGSVASMPTYPSGTILNTANNSSGQVAVNAIQGAASARLDLVHLGAAADNKFMELIDSNGGLNFRSIKDDGSASVVPSILYLHHSTGNVGIGTTNPTTKLSVNGTISTKEVVVTNTGWSDYVFKPGYRLKPLKEIAAFVKTNHHLPEIPSEAEVKEKGVGVGEMQAKLLAKVEELTLHMIQAEERNDRLEQEIRQLRNRITPGVEIGASSATPSRETGQKPRLTQRRSGR